MPSQPSSVAPGALPGQAIQTAAVATDPPSGFARLIPLRLRGWWADMAEGFHAHGWSGKLYLASGGIGWISTIVMAPVGISVVASGAGGEEVNAGTAIVLSVVLVLSLYMGFRVLTGVARFHRRARNFAIFFSAFTTVATFTQLKQSPALTLTLLVQAALSVQFIIYFLRNGHRFLSAEQRLLPTTDAATPTASHASRP